MNDEPEAHNHAEHIRQAQQYRLVHGQHAGLHQALFVILLVILALSQIGLFFWKKKHYRSFQNVTLFGLWIIPFGFAAYLMFFRMLFVWTVFSVITAYLIKQASQTPLAKETPRRIYGWFYLVWISSYSSAILGYIILMLDLLGISRALALTFWLPLTEYTISASMMFLFYGLYFGVLGRDCAEMCTERVASRMGYTGKNLPAKAIPINGCGICGEQYDTTAIAELNCKHSFHEWCIRGWTIIGKKDTCPYCSEKVQLKQLFRNPWEKQGILWANLLDSLRYLIVWNPIILVAINFVIYMIDPGA